MSALAEELRKTIQGEVFDDEKTLEKYSIDASLYRVKPQVVVSPRDLDDLKALVRFAAEKKDAGEEISLTPRSAGTDMTGGPLGESIIVDFLPHFNKVLATSATEATVEPGVFYRDLDKATLVHGTIMPGYPASRELCTVGGMVANNAGGEKTLQYGKTANYVTELSVILADGNEYTIHSLTLSELEEKKQLETFEGRFYRDMHALVLEHKDALKAAEPNVSKNSSGYALWDVLDEANGVFDLTKLFVGSQGTLGLITKVTFKLVRPKAHSRLLVIFLKDMDILSDLVRTLRTHNPESMESYDDHTFKIALKLFPQIVKRLGGNIFMLGFRFLPEFFATLTGGVPKLVLLAEFTAESDAEALRMAKKAQAAIKRLKLKNRITTSPKDAEKYWVVRRESFNLLRQKMKDLRTAPFIEDVVVHPDVLPEFLPELYALLDAYPLTYTIAGHMGDGNFHIIPLMNLRDPQSKEIIRELIVKTNTLVEKYHGSNTAEHNDGLLRTPYLRDVFGDAIYTLFVRTKEIFDPNNIFNPGKKVGEDKAFAEAHIDTR